MSAINRPGQVLSVREREMIRNRVRANELRLEGRIVVPGNRATGDDPAASNDRRVRRWESTGLSNHIKEDQTIIRRQIERDRRILAAGDPGSLSKREKTALERKVVAQKEWLRQHMCPKTLFHVKREDPNFDKAKDACFVEHTPEFQKVATEYKQAMRQLDPDNPKASNMEYIRPD